MKKKISDILIIALGSLILAVGINAFLLPAKISTGGVSGVATLIYHTLSVPMWVTTLMINLLLFAFGAKTLKRSAVIKNLFGIALLSLFLRLTEWMAIPCEDILISSVLGGILVGVGVGLAVLREGSTGGSDFAAIMLNKAFPYISVASFILIIDAVVIFTSGAVFWDIKIMFYSALSLYISSKVTDFILIRGDFAKSIYIISKEHERIAEFVMSGLARGVTAIYSHGCYSGSDCMMLMCIVRSREAQRVLSKIKEIDRDAFVIISDVREVCGDGFKEI